MYVIQKSTNIHEELIVQLGNNTPDLHLKVDLDIDDVLQNYNRLRRILGEAQELLQKSPENEEYKIYYGKVLVEFFTIIFGSNGVEKILQVYENKYDQMLIDIAPFIVDCIQPQINKAMQLRIEKYKALSRKAWRARK